MGILKIRDFNRKWCRICNLTAPGKLDSPKLCIDVGYRYEKKVGWGILIKKEWECSDESRAHHCIQGCNMLLFVCKNLTSVHPNGCRVDAK